MDPYLLHLAKTEIFNIAQKYEMQMIINNQHNQGPTSSYYMSTRAQHYSNGSSAARVSVNLPNVSNPTSSCSNNMSSTSDYSNSSLAVATPLTSPSDEVGNTHNLDSDTQCTENPLSTYFKQYTPL